MYSLTRSPSPSVGSADNYTDIFKVTIAFMNQPLCFSGIPASHTGGGIALLQSGCIESADRPRMPGGCAQ